MAALNHIIVWSRDRQRSAAHLAEILGLDPPRKFTSRFLVVDLANGVSIDYADRLEGEITTQHLAFLVSEEEFDAIYGRIKAQELPHWADPMQQTPNTINHHDGGRGVYWADPDGNILEIITRPYGPEAEASGS